MEEAGSLPPAGSLLPEELLPELELPEGVLLPEEPLPELEPPPELAPPLAPPLLPEQPANRARTKTTARISASFLFMAISFLEIFRNLLRNYYFLIIA